MLLISHRHQHPGVLGTPGSRSEQLGSSRCGSVVSQYCCYLLHQDHGWGGTDFSLLCTGGWAAGTSLLQVEYHSLVFQVQEKTDCFQCLSHSTIHTTQTSIVLYQLFAPYSMSCSQASPIFHSYYILSITFMSIFQFPFPPKNAWCKFILYYNFSVPQPLKKKVLTIKYIYSTLRICCWLLEKLKGYWFLLVMPRYRSLMWDIEVICIMLA